MSEEEIVDNILSDDYLKIDRKLIRGFKSIPLAAYTSELFFRYKGIKRNRNLKDGFFYCTRKTIEEHLHISDSTQKKYQDILIEKKLIEIKLEGTSPFSSKIYYKINFPNLLQFMLDNKK